MSSSPTNKTVNIYINSPSAQKTLDDLQARANKFTDAIQKGEKAGKDMTDTIAKLGATKSKISELEQIISGKMAPSLTMVKNRANELRRELERMSADAPGYAAKFKEFTEVNKTLTSMKLNISNVGSRMKDIGKIAFGTLIGNSVQAGLQAITGYISGIVSGNAKLSDSLADVQKATGLTAGEVKKLNSSLGNLNTRTATADLRDIAIGLGQIGEAATPEAVAAIDKIVVALGDEFGGGAKEITTTLGILRNNLQDIKSDNYGADVLAIGNALNVLGAEGLATAPVVTDFATRMSGIAGTFKLTSGEILGLSATMQELGINVERGSTATIKILQKIAAEPAKFAVVAGQSVKEFTDLINNDMAAAFNAVAVGAGKASGKNTEFAKVLKELDADGSGAGEVLSKLSKNQELLANKTKLASDALKSNTSIMEEFNTKNTNLAANLAKLYKNIAGWFTNSVLVTFLNNAVNLMAKLTSSTEELNAQQKQQADLQKKIATAASASANAAEIEERNLTNLYRRSQDLNFSMSDRLNAAKDLQKSYPETFANFTQEAILAGKASVAYQNLAASILTKAKANAAQSEVDVIAREMLSAEQNIELQKNLLKGAEDQMTRLRKLGGDGSQINYEQVKSFKNQLSIAEAYLASLEKRQKALADKVIVNTPTVSGGGGGTGNGGSGGGSSRGGSGKLKEAIDNDKKLNTAYFDWFKKEIGGTLNFDKIYSDRVDASKKAYNDERNIILQGYIDGTKSREEYNNALDRLAEEQLQEEILIAEQYAPVSEKAYTDKEAKKTKALEIAAAKRDRITKTETQRELTEYEKWVKKVQSKAAPYIEAAQMLSSSLSSVFQELNNKENQELQNEEARYNKKKANLDKQLADKKISQAKYNKEVAKMEAELDEKRKAFQLKQFNRDKALAIVNGTISGITASLKALELGPILGPIMAGIIGTMALAQVAMIAAQKPPEFEVGGVLPGRGGVPSGPRHANGGIALMDPNGQKRGEIEGGEPILSVDTYRNNRALVDALLDTSMNKGGASLSWLNNMGSRLNYQRSADNLNFNRMYGSGGIATPSSSQSSGKALSESDMIAAMQAFTAQLQQGVMAYTYYNDTDRKNNEIQNLKKISSANPRA